jgi:hypothetical protein
MSMCNFCIMEDIKSRAEKSNKTVVTKSANFPAIRDYNNGSPGIDVFVDEIFQAWFMELPDKCEC